MPRQLGLFAHPLPHLLHPLPAALEIRPQPALLLDRLVHLPARRDGVRLFAIHDTMRFLRPPESTMCIGQAASAAAVLLAAGEPGMRYTLPNARADRKSVV